MGVNVEQGWGMTETSPIVTYNSPTPASAVLVGEEAIRQRLKQGRASCGTDMKIVDAEGSELPWDGKAFGDFLVRGHWVCREYLNRGAEGAADSDCGAARRDRAGGEFLHSRCRPPDRQGRHEGCRTRAGHAPLLL